MKDIGDDEFARLVAELRADGAFTLFARAVTAALEEVVLLQQPGPHDGSPAAHQPADMPAVARLKQFAADGDLGRLEAALLCSAATTSALPPG